MMINKNIIIIIVGIAILIGIVIGVSSLSSEQKFVDHILLDPRDLSEEECLANGGEWGIWWLTDNPPWCNLPTYDGGTECTDSSECESFCQAKEGSEFGSYGTGTCYEKTFSSCFNEILNSTVQGEMCS